VGWIDDRIENGKALTAKNLYTKFGFKNVIGVHLYGRNAVAGPICATALILKPTHKFDLKSPDQLSMSECYKLNGQIRKKADMLNIGWASVSVINKFGVQEAIMSAIRTALAGVSAYNPPSIVLVDGFQMHPLPNGLRDSQTPVFTVKKGKEQVDIIAAASIVGRVARDSLMSWMHREYPEYEWEQNEGFATPRHIELIKEYGISMYHRDLSNVKALKDFEAFPNRRWKEQYENSYFGE
jgi:ribonuclease HII